jgi:hypothetical protein
VNLVAKGKGGINVHELLARKDIKGLAEDGDIMMTKLNGRNVVLVVNHTGNSVSVDNASIADSMQVAAENTSFGSILHADDSKYLQLQLSGVKGAAMNDVDIGRISSDKGVQLQGLWANTADIAADCEYFRLKDVYLIDKGYLTNGHVTMTVFGRNPVVDGSDVQVYFVPDGINRFTQISFQNEFAEFGRENYEVLRNRDGFKQPDNQMSRMEEIAGNVQDSDEAVSGKTRMTSPLSALTGMNIPGSLESIDTGEFIDGQLQERLSIQNNAIVFSDTTESGDKVPVSAMDGDSGNGEMEDENQ